jgi:hypothetical protein
LIQAFDKPLPSAQKIQATVEVQQAKMSEGKMESLGVEIVAVKADGDVLVGAPKVAAEAPAKKEEPKADAPAKKEDVVAKKEEGGAGKKEEGGGKPEPKADAKMAGGPAPDNLDISTAAGPGAEARPAPTTAPAPAPKAPAPAVAFAVPAGASVVGQIINGATKAPDSILVGRAPEGTVVIGDPNNPFTISLSSPLKNAARVVFTVTIGSITVGDSFSVEAGASSFSILGSKIPDPRIYTVGQTAVVTLTLPGTIGTITQTIKLDSRPLDDPVVQAFNPTRLLITGPSDSRTVAALAKFFYFTGKAEGVAGPSRFFSDLSSSTRSLANYSDRSVTLYDGRVGDFYAMGTLQTSLSAPQNITLGSDDTVIFANRINLGQAGLGSRVLSKVADREIPDFNPAGYTSALELSSGDLASTSALPFYVLSASLKIDPADAMGMFAGDYKAYLTYMNSAGAGQTINLLDRIGTSVSDREGSAANGIAATFSDYGTGQAIDSEAADPIAGTLQPGSGDTLLQEAMGAISAAGSFFMTVGDLSEGGLGVLHSWSVTLAQRVKISVLNGVEYRGEERVEKKLSLISGLGGTEVTGTLWDVGQANLEFLSAGFMEVNDSEFYNLGSELRFESAQDLSLDGIGVRGEAVGANGAALEVLTSGNLLVQAASFVGLSPVRETSFKSLGQIQMGATTEELDELTKLETSAGRNPSEVQEALQDYQEQKQVRIESRGSVSSGVASSSGIAVIRSATGLEMRDVVIRGFSEVRLEKGSELDAPRVLVSGSTVRDFKITELVGPLINADSKIQMAALDASGQLAGTMVVGNRGVPEGNVKGLPVKQVLAGVLDNAITDERRNILVDAQTISLAARRLEFQNTTMAAMTAITARANTVLLNNANFTVIAQNGMINFYTREGLVNRNFGSEVDSDNGMLNFSGVNNFRIGTTTFTVQDQATLNTHLDNKNIFEAPHIRDAQLGKVNVLKM